MSGDGARDRRERDRLAVENRGLAWSIAREYEGRGLDLDDLVAAGYLGLVDAAARFEPGRGTAFGSYAGHWIRLRIRDALIANGLIRFPNHTFRLVGRFIRESRALRIRLGREPGREEVYDALGLAPGRREILDAALATLAREGLDPGLDAPEPEPGPAAAAERRDEFEVLRRRVGDLDDAGRAVIVRRYGLDGGPPQSCKEAGRELGISGERVNRIEHRALLRLRIQYLPLN